MSGSGYQADTDGMRAAASGFAGVRDRVQTVATGLGATKVPDGAFGKYGPGPRLAADLDEIVGAHQRFLATRQQEIGKLADGINAAADTYDNTDSSGATGITDAGRGA